MYFRLDVMKVFLSVMVCCLLGLAACTVEKPGNYIGENYIQFYYGSPVTFDMVTMPVKPLSGLNANRLQDTAYFRVQVIGQPSDAPRKVRFEQYVDERDVADQAVAGVNYVSFDDPSILKLMVIPGDSAYFNIPVVMLYDKAIAGMNKACVLRFRIVDSEDLILGQAFLSKGLLTFSQKK